MRYILIVTVLGTFAIANTAFAQADNNNIGGACSAEYSAEQCCDMGFGCDGGAPTGGSGGTSCPYYLCGNATGAAQSNWVWCRTSQNYVDCPIAYCQYSPCVGTNCTPQTITCSDCPDKSGTNAHITECPRTNP